MAGLLPAIDIKVYKMNQYVGGIYINSENKVLLIKRSEFATRLPRLWSIPGGKVEQGESLERAMEREFKEETRLEIYVTEKLLFIERNNWEVTIFIVKKMKGVESSSYDDKIETISFFNFHDIPEKIVLESFLAVTLFYKNKLKARLNHFDTIDSIYSSIYYTYLDKDFHQSVNYSKEMMLLYNICVSTPKRKFKSSLIYLLSKPNTIATNLYYVLPEIMFAIWTLLDDFADEKYSRYNKPTVCAKYSHKQLTTLCYLILEYLRQYVDENLKSFNPEEIAQLMVQCGHSSLIRFSNKNNFAKDEYIKNSQSRSYFLGTTWEYILNKCGFQIEKNFIKNIYPETSGLGQILNDYYDFFINKTYDDYFENIISYPTILLHEKIVLNQTDFKSFKALWFKNDKKRADLKNYIRLFEKYKIKEIHYKEIENRFNSIIQAVQNSGIEFEKKVIFQSWIDLQFGRTLNSENVDINKLIQFIYKLTKV